eukprot:1958396-Rhodomonas_salina.4
MQHVGVQDQDAQRRRGGVRRERQENKGEGECRQRWRRKHCTGSGERRGKERYGERGEEAERSGVEQGGEGRSGEEMRKEETRGNEEEVEDEEEGGCVTRWHRPEGQGCPASPASAPTRRGRDPLPASAYCQHERAHDACMVQARQTSMTPGHHDARHSYETSG